MPIPAWVTHLFSRRLLPGSGKKIRYEGAQRFLAMAPGAFTKPATSDCDIGIVRQVCHAVKAGNFAMHEIPHEEV